MTIIAGGFKEKINRSSFTSGFNLEQIFSLGIDLIIKKRETIRLRSCLAGLLLKCFFGGATFYGFSSSSVQQKTVLLKCLIWLI
jgi:hypothetical protein